MKKMLLFFLCASFCLPMTAQTIIDNQNVDQFSMDAAADKEYGLTWLPASYASNPSKKYPLIIFLHGSGEAGTGQAALSGLSAWGLPAKIKAGFQPMGVNPKDGQTYEFIVCSPMASSWAPDYTTLKYILPDILSRYHVDTTRIYLTGFSAGGGTAIGAVSCADSNFIKKFAAVATTSQAGITAVNGLTEDQVLAQIRFATGKYAIPVWEMVGDQDSRIDDNAQYIDSLNITSPTVPDKLTIVSGQVHEGMATQGFDSAFRPILSYYGHSAVCNSGCPAITAPSGNGSPVRGSGVTQDSLNIYEWLLTHIRRSTATTPTANAGSNQSITLPTNSITLSGSGTAGTGHTISSYAWTKVSGGTATITSPAGATTTVTGLVQGTYVFRLTVTNNVSATATSDVTITVNAPAVANAGSNQSITLPTNSVTLNGSASTGTISSYSWTKISGGTATITSPSSATTTVTGLAAGTYVFQLSLNSGASTATVTITVNTGGSMVGNQAVTKFPIDAGGDSLYGLTWLPDSYSSSPSKKYPLIIYLHGSSQAGTGQAGLSNLLTIGLPQKIAGGLHPSAVNPRDGQTYEFIVVSPQDPSWTPTYDKLKYILPSILSRYQVDSTRIYLTGVATGGDALFSTLGSADSNFIKRFAAASTANSIGVDGVNGLTDVQVLAQLRNATKKYNVQVWTVAGDQDGHLSTDVAYHDSVNKAGPTIPDKLTVIGGATDTTWKQLYDTAWRPLLSYYGNTANCDNGCASITAPSGNISSRRGAGATQDSLNLFEWLLLYQRSISTPTANAGSNQTITLPVDSVTLTGTGTSGIGHTISSYGWTRVSGGSATIVSPSSASTKVTGLLQGTYVFRLTITNNSSVTATSDVTITVNGNASGPYGSPTISASANQTLPTNSASVSSTYTLTGSTLNSIVWTKFSVPGQAKKKIGILGSSTSAGSGASVYDSSYAGRLTNYYRNAGLIDSVINLAVSGYNPYQAMPTGYTPPIDVTNKLSPSDSPDPAHNITALLTHHPDIVLVNFPTNGFDVLTLPEVMTPLQAIYDSCTAHGVECYVTTTQPRTDATFRSGASQQFLQVLRDSILNRFGTHAIDFYDPVVLPGTYLQTPAYMYGDSIHLDDAGHLQLFNKVVGANIFKNQISSPASISSPTTASTSITNLPQGISKFQVTVTDAHLQSASAVTTLTVSSTACSGTRHILAPDPVDSSVYFTAGTSPSSLSFLPGDTLVLNSAYSSIDLQSIQGTAACPIVITNQTVQALITKRLNLDGCQYVKVTGSGTAAPYGILIQQDPVLRQQYYDGIDIFNRSRGIEIERVSMHNVSLGIVCETNEDCDNSLNYPNWILDSMSFHDNKIVGTWNEGMYLGNTSPDNASYDLRPVVCNGVTYYYAPMKNGYTKVYNNIVDSTGRGGIQLANAAYGISEIYGNTVKHNGLNGDDAQGTAISLGLYTRAYVHDNTIVNTFTWGIVSLGAGSTDTAIRIEHNTIDSTGYLAHYDLATTNRIVYNPGTEPSYADTLSWPQSIEIDTRPRLYTTDTPHPGTAIPGMDSTRFQVRNNTIGHKKNTVAVNIEDDYAGIQKSGNYVCGNVNAGTGTPATIHVASGINYSTDCSGLSSEASPLLTVNPSKFDTDSSNRSIHVYPNPVIGNSITVTVQSESIGKLKISLFDVSGRLIREKLYSKQTNFFQQQLDLPASLKGIYLLKIEQPGKGSPDTFKLIRE